MTDSMPNPIREVAEGAFELVRFGLDDCDECPASLDGSCLRDFCDEDSGDHLVNKCERAFATLRTIFDALLAVVEKGDALADVCDPECGVYDERSAYNFAECFGCSGGQQRRCLAHSGYQAAKASLESIVDGSRE